MSSGLAASTVDSRTHEQDLAGFPEVEHSRQSTTAEHSRQSASVEHSRKSASLEHSRLGPAQVDKEVLATAPKLDMEPHDVQAHAIGTSVHTAAAGPQSVGLCSEMHAFHDHLISLMTANKQHLRNQCAHCSSWASVNRHLLA